MGATRRADGALSSDRVDGPFNRRLRRQSLPMRKRIPASTKPKAELVSRKSCLPAVSVKCLSTVRSGVGSAHSLCGCAAGWLGAGVGGSGFGAAVIRGKASVL